MAVGTCGCAQLEAVFTSLHPPDAEASVWTDYNGAAELPVSKLFSYMGSLALFRHGRMRLQRSIFGVGARLVWLGGRRSEVHACQLLFALPVPRESDLDRATRRRLTLLVCTASTRW